MAKFDDTDFDLKTATPPRAPGATGPADPDGPGEGPAAETVEGTAEGEVPADAIPPREDGGAGEAPAAPEGGGAESAAKPRAGSGKAKTPAKRPAARTGGARGRAKAPAAEAAPAVDEPAEAAEVTPGPDLSAAPALTVAYADPGAPMTYAPPPSVTVPARLIAVPRASAMRWHALMKRAAALLPDFNADVTAARRACAAAGIPPGSVEAALLAMAAEAGGTPLLAPTEAEAAELERLYAAATGQAPGPA